MDKKLIQFVLIIIVTLIGAAIIFKGSIFSENNTGIAIFIGIFGICLIATSSPCKVKK
jgi:hypothetical protein